MLNPTKLLLIALIWFCKSTSLPKLYYNISNKRGISINKLRVCEKLGQKAVKLRLDSIYVTTKPIYEQFEPQIFFKKSKKMMTSFFPVSVLKPKSRPRPVLVSQNFCVLGRVSLDYSPVMYETFKKQNEKKH